MANESTQGRGLSRLFNDRKIATKIAIGFAIVLSITAVISASAYFAFTKVDDSFRTFARQAGNGVRAATIDQNFLFVRWQAREFGLTGQQSFLDGAKKGLVTLAESIQKADAQLTNPERKRKMAEITKEAETWKQAFEKMVALRQDEAKIIKEILDPFGAKLSADYQEFQAAAVKTGNSNAAVLAGEGAVVTMQARLAVNKLLARHDAEAAKIATKAFADLKQVLSGLDGATRGSDARQLYDEMKMLTDKYHEGYTKAVADAHEIETLLNGEMRRIGGVIATLATEIKDATLAAATHEEHAAESLIGSIEVLILVLAIGGLTLGALLAWLIGRGISKPVIALVPELKKLAEGDFNISLTGLGRKDEVGAICEAVNAVAERVGATITTIKVTASEVTNASGEISTATTDLSQRTEEQAASLEETSASMEEMTATVKKNAENAKEASQLANGTREVADRGGQVVAQTVEAMAKIEDSSRKISDIISVIDEIARQTNLLALNAAVEAARAGDAGRGFAVVASEVRSLAQRSSQAAKDIKDLITNSTGQVKEGVDLVNRAGTALTEIVESIKKVTNVVAEIANASTEQSAGIEQISKALAQMDEVTQQNSALVEENAATAKTLESQAKSMDERVAFFRLREGGSNAQFSRPADTNDGNDTAAEAAPQRPAAAPARPAPVRQPAAAPKRAVAGPARRMQTSLATALKDDPEWKEF